MFEPRNFLAENGWFLLLQKLVGGALRRVRDKLIARKLRTTGLRLGRHIKLSGMSHIQMGKHFSAGDNVWLDAITNFAGTSFTPQIEIGDHVNFSNNVHVACTNHVIIKNGVLIGSNVVITDHGHGRYAGPSQSRPDEVPGSRMLTNDRTVRIAQNVWIGDGVAILPGAEVGEGSIVGANSIVTGSIPPFCIAVGAPARPIRLWNPETKEWERLSIRDDEGP